MSARAVVFTMAVLIAVPGLAGAAECGQGCGKAYVQKVKGETFTPYFGNVIRGDVVGIYVDQAGLASPAFSEQTILGGIEIWTKGCPNDPVPKFESRWGKELADGWDTNPAKIPITLSVAYLDQPPTRLGSGKWRLAEYGGGKISIFARCPTDWLQQHPERCRGTLVDWASEFAKTVFAHEMGHALGLNHDDCTTKLMQDGFSWGHAAEIVDGHCRLAAAVNDAEELCGQASSVDLNQHPCELCQVSIGGSVAGLDADLSVDLTLNASYRGTNLPQATKGRTGTGFSFGHGIPEGASWSVSVEAASHDAFLCNIGNHPNGIAGTSDVGDVEVQCSCVDVTDPRCITGGVPSSDHLVPLNRIGDFCVIFPAACRLDDSFFGPWYWSSPGPVGTVFVEDPKTCVPIDPNDPESPLICTTEASFVGSGETVVLTGPSMMIDRPAEQVPVAGTVEVTGWMSHPQGVAGAVFYLDEEEVQLGGYRTGLHRPDACAGRAGDCRPDVGFSGLLDTRHWPDGIHLLTVSAVNGDPQYPIITRYDRAFEIDNTCAAGSSLSVGMTAPSAGALIFGAVSVQASATGTDEIERLRLMIDGLPIASDFSPPYRWTWNTSGWPDGTHVISVEARDTCGRTEISGGVEITVRNANDPPALAVESPTSLLQLAGVAPVSGWAIDADEVSSIVLRLGGQNLPLASPLAWTSRSDVCSSSGIADPRCPNVGWSTSFDTTLWPDGTYRLDVVAIDGRGASTLRSLSLSIRNAPISPPTVSTPASKTIVAGSDVSFQVTASGEAPLSYDWQYRLGTSWRLLAEGERGGRVQGVKSPALTLLDVVTSDATAYRVLVSNGGGTTASGSASLTVEEVIGPPTVTAGLDQEVIEGETAFLSVSAQGAGPLTFRWQKWSGSWVNLFDGGRVSGSATSTLSIGGTVLADQGSYRAVVSNEGGTTLSGLIGLTVDPIPVGTCVPDATTLCYQADRFAVTAQLNGSSAWAMPFSQEGGFFWLFEPNTIEVAVKLLDGRSANGHFWVFHGALTDLAYTLTVTDTITGAVKTYLKGAGHFCGEGDTAAFGGSTSTAGAMVPLGPLSIFGPSAACQSSATAACLFNDKFRVEVHRAGAPQPGVAVTNLSASFGFVAATAPEVVVKVIDGTSVNGWYWLFFGSLTHQAFTVEVTDTATGEHRSYASPADFCGEADTTAF